MKKLFNKKASIAIISIALLATFGAGAYADSALKQITAYQNSALKITVSGKQINQSSSEGTMYPLVFEGHSYVSAKSLAEALGATVNYNADTLTVEITPAIQQITDGLPTKDNTEIRPITGDKKPPIDDKKPIEDKKSSEDKKSLNDEKKSTGDNKNPEKVHIINVLNKGFNKDEISHNLSGQMVLFLNSIIKTTKTGDTTNLDKIISGMVIDKSSDNGLLGKQSTIDSVHAYIDNFKNGKSVEAIDAWSIGAISDMSNFKLSEVNVTDGLATFKYVLPTTGLYVQASFKHTANNDKYVLESLTVNN